MFETYYSPEETIEKLHFTYKMGPFMPQKKQQHRPRYGTGTAAINNPHSV